MATYGGPNYNIGETYNEFVSNINSNGGTLINIPSDDLKQGMSTLKYDPSILMVPNGFIGNQLPSMVPTDGTGDFTVSRNGTATYFDKNGVLRVAAANEPRFDYDPLTGEFKGVLVEPQMTNSWTNNNNSTGYDTITNAIKGATIPNAFAPGIDGFEYTFTEGSTFLSSLYSIRTISALGSTVFRMCLYIKNPSSDFFGIYHSGGIGQCMYQFSTLTTRNYFTPATENGKIVKINDDTYALYLWSDATSGTQYSQVRVGFVTALNNTNIIDGTAIIGLGQFNGGTDTSVPTIYSPIITTGSSVTRPADAVYKTNAIDLIGQIKGSVYCEFYFKNINNFQRIFNISLDSANRIDFYINPNSPILTLDSKKTGFDYTLFPTTNIGTLNIGFNKIIYNYNENVISVFLNGTKVFTRTGDFSEEWGLNKIALGRGWNGGSQYMDGSIKLFQLTKTTLTDEEAISLTTL